MFGALPVRAAHPVRLLTFGDSLTAGYGLPHEQGFEVQLQAALSKAGLPVTVLDGGVSGDTSAGGLARLDWVLADKPDAAIVELGANDGLRGTDPAEMEKNLSAILARFRAAGIPVLLTGMYAPPNMGEPYDTAFRAVFDKLGHQPGVLYDPFFLQGVAADPSLNQADRMHPNAEGVQRIVERLLPMVKALVAEAGGA
jgi:acyl-CoA thioesterase I